MQLGYTKNAVEQDDNEYILGIVYMQYTSFESLKYVGHR